jgi:hypothetical protein
MHLKFETLTIQKLLAFFSTNAHSFVDHTLRLNFPSLRAQVIGGLLEMRALRVHAVELEILGSQIYPDVGRLLESLRTLSGRTSNVRIRLARINRGVIDSLVNGLLDWLHGVGGGKAEQPNRTLGIDICRSLEDSSFSKNAENFFSALMEVILYNLTGFLNIQKKTGKKYYFF